MGGYKPPIIDRTEQATLLKACDGDNEYVPIWLMMRLGVPAIELQRGGVSAKNRYVYWLRQNNAIPRRATATARIVKRIERWIASGRKRSPSELTLIIAKIGARIGHAEYSVLTLWNTNGVNQLRNALDEGLSLDTAVNLVAERMGRKVDGVKELYLEYEKWRAADGEAIELARMGMKEVVDVCQP